jgi:hypothetical protein
MKNINWNRFHYKVNIDFFKNWSPQMAYILGFTCADGNVYKTTLAWDLKKDRELLQKINQAIRSSYPIHKRKASFRLRISNPIIVEDLKKLGISPNKSKNLRLPEIPSRFFSHFARGFYDGDGWICIRRDRNEISVGFSNGSKVFLTQFIEALRNQMLLPTPNIRTRKKTTKKGARAITYSVEYYWNNAYKILRYLYSGVKSTDLLMKRKYQKFQQAKQLYEWVKSGGRKWRKLENEFRQPMREILFKLWQTGYNAPQIANKLNVHHSSIYRWLIKAEVRPPFTEIRRRGVIDE